MQDTDTGYQGYANKATWNADLWLNNDEPSYKNLQFLLANTASDSQAASLLHDWAREFWGTDTPDGQPLEDVNWLEIIQKNRED